MGIPRIIHHVWPGADPFRAELHEFRHTWMRHHPDWTMLFWRTGDALSGHAVEHTGVAQLLADRRYTVVVKSDVLRLWALLEHGGLYVDTDFECLRPFDSLMSPAGGFFCGKEDAKMCSPSLMGAEPGHPLVSDLLEEALRRVRQTPIDTCNINPNKVTGPHLLTELVRGRDVTVYGPEWFYPIPGPQIRRRAKEATPGAYAKHHFAGWSSADGWTHRPTFG